MIDESLATKLYDLVSENAVKLGFDMPFSKSVFQDSFYNSEAFSPLDYVDYENKDYLEVLYLKLLKRPPEAGVFNNWSERLSLPKDEFQKFAFNNIFNSTERKMKGSVVKNNIFEN